MYSLSNVLNSGIKRKKLVPGVNGLQIGQREPKEVESANPFPNPAQGSRGPSKTLARPARNTYGGPQLDWPIKCNQGILPAKAPQEL